MALEFGALPGPPTLFRLPGLSPIVQGVYEIAADLCEVRTLPWAHETPAAPFPGAAGFARVIELRDFAFEPGFRGVAMIDFFLARLGLDPAAVPPARRRNAWLAPRLGLPDRRPGHAPGYALVCPRTSMALRDMPAAAHLEVLRGLRGAGWPVLTQGELPEGAPAGVRAVLPVGHFTQLCELVAGAALMVSADTAMPHLADALGVPCLAIYTTHRPEWRGRDYPRLHAVHLPVPGLPPALEFARSPEDEAAAQAAWQPPGVGLDWLLPALSRLIAAAR